ncbi:uncharacterized protein LOC120011235 isoform X2 [Tripterygium wilfordii]|uniref:uncharacterized protein LOC120011235 isoform X2 n=1 Tax=Tripterygium wilfordii TaxID=458696 RepID=UPI0018F804FC|nr:uncharacterized protein LOC120011235 isoform X2 [Tripterygium wilfordii]
MKMVLTDIHIETQLMETGNSLLNPPSSTIELRSLLDKAEHLLANVDQAPSRATQDAMLPIMKALIGNDLFRHSDMDVKVSVADCISEITRISAPDAPYNDDMMKEYFQLAVEALENLSLVSGRCYTKAISILDTLARCRSCLVMLDLECDSLIIKMFQIFFKVIRSNHPHIVFTSMETIMTMVIDESEEVSVDLINPLLASVRQENQSVSPISWKLGEQVLVSCASKLQPYLKDAVQSIGVALDEYAPIVAALWENKTNTLDNDDGSGSGEHLEEHRLVNGEGLIELPEEEHGLVNGEGSIEPPEVKEELSPDAMSKSELENVPFKRGRRPNSFLNPEEGYDYSWIFKDKKTPKVPGRVKSRDRGSGHSSSKTPVSENTDLTSRHDRGTKPPGYTSKVGEGIGSSSPIPKHSLPDKSHPKRGRPRKKKNLVNQAVDPNTSSVLKVENLRAEAEEKYSQSTDISLKKKPEENSKLEAGQRKHMRKTSNFATAFEEMTASQGFVAKVKKAVPGPVKSRDKGSDHSSSKTPVSENTDLTSRHDRGTKPPGYTSKAGEGIGSSSPIPKHSLPDISRPKRGRPRKNKNMVNQAVDPNLSSVLKGENLRAEAEEKYSQSTDLTSRHDRGTKPPGYTSKVGEGIGSSSPIPKHSLPDKNHPKRGRPRKNKNLVNQAVNPNPSSVLKGENLRAEDGEKYSQSTDISLKRKPEENSKLEAEQRKHMRKTSNFAMAFEEMDAPQGFVAKVKKAEILSEREEKAQQLSISKAGVRIVNDHSSSVKKDVYRRSVDSVSDRNTTEASGSKSISKSTFKASNKDGNQLEEMPKSKLKRKHSMRKEVSSGIPYHGNQLVGRTIKVWWPMDKEFYKGVVDSYDPVKEKHEVLYADGDIETLNLRKECWELVEDDVLPHEGQGIDLPKLDNPPDRLEKQKGKKRKLESGKQRSANVSIERSGATDSAFEVKARNSGKTDKAVQVDTSVDAATQTDNLKDDNKESAGNLRMESPGAVSTPTRSYQRS